MLKYPIVEVEWVDSGLCGGWHDIEDAEKGQPLFILSTGYLLKKTKTHLTLIGGVDSENEMVQLRNVIPCSAVKSITVLRK